MFFFSQVWVLQVHGGDLEMEKVPRDLDENMGKIPETCGETWETSGASDFEICVLCENMGDEDRFSMMKPTKIWRLNSMILLPTKK